MIRLLGGILGSALAIALLLLVVGIPQFRAPAESVEPAVMTLPLRTTPVDDPIRDDATAPADDDVSAAAAADRSDRATVDGAADLRPAPATDSVDQTVSPAADTLTDTVADRLAEPEFQATEADAAVTTVSAADPQWYTFWSPFRSEVAASGFVARLQSVTGLDYRIVRREPGVYEVAFAYRDDEEITNNLSHITAATGLDLAGR